MKRYVLLMRRACIFNNVGLTVHISYFCSFILNTDCVIAANMEYRCSLMTLWCSVNHGTKYVLYIWTHRCCFAFLSILPSGNLQEVCEEVDSPPQTANKLSYDSFCYECLIYDGFVFVKLPSRQKSNFKKLWHHSVKSILIYASDCRGAILHLLSSSIMNVWMWHRQKYSQMM